MKTYSEEITAAFDSVDKPLIVVGIPSGFAFLFVSELSLEGGALLPIAQCRIQVAVQIIVLPRALKPISLTKQRCQPRHPKVQLD